MALVETNVKSPAPQIYVTVCIIFFSTYM